MEIQTDGVLMVEPGLNFAQVDILHHDKAQTANDNQEGNGEGDQRISGKSSHAAVPLHKTQDVEARVAISGNSAEDGGPDAVHAKHGHKAERQQAGADRLTGKGKNDGQAQQPRNIQAAASRAFACQLHLSDAQLTPHQQRKADRQGREAQAPQLDAAQDYPLTEGRPQGVGIPHHQACHTGGRRGSKKGVDEGSSPYLRGDGQHQQQGPHQNDQGKADDNHPYRRRSLDLVTKLLADVTKTGHSKITLTPFSMIFSMT